MSKTIPIVKLSNHLVVANFGSNHEFVFEDGSVLMPCSEERAEYTKVDPGELTQERVFNYRHATRAQDASGLIRINDVVLKPQLKPEVAKELRLIFDMFYESVHVCIVPYMMQEAMANYTGDAFAGVSDKLYKWYRSIRRRGRGGPIRIDAFCCCSLDVMTEV